MKWKLLPTKWKKNEEEKEKQIAHREEKYLTPRDFFESFQRSIDELFEDFGYPDFFSKERTFYPKVDVTENEKEIVIKADIPGIDEKDLEVSITKDAVILQGEKKYEHEEKQGNYYRKERSFGSFRRVIPLPVEVDETKAETNYKNGVVTITLPKSQEATKNIKKIPIKVVK